MIKIVATGGAGFIGSVVVRQAIRLGQEVVNPDCLTYAANLESVASVAETAAYAYEKADFRDCLPPHRIFASHLPDAVMHFAAESQGDRSIDEPAAFAEITSMGFTTSPRRPLPIGRRMAHPRCAARRAKRVGPPTKPPMIRAARIRPPRPRAII